MSLPSPRQKTILLGFALVLSTACFAGAGAAASPSSDRAEEIIEIDGRRLLPPVLEPRGPYGGSPKTGQISFVSEDSLTRWGVEGYAEYGASLPSIQVDPLDSAGRNVLALSAPGPRACSALTLFLKHAPTAAPWEYNFAEEWVAARVLLERGDEPMQGSDELLEFCQILGDPTNPAIALGLSQDDRLLTWGSDLSPHLSATVLPVGTWFDLLVHWRAATPTEPGLVEVWIDGAPVTDLQPDHQDERGVDKLRLCAANIDRDEASAAWVQWIAWGEEPSHAVYRPALTLAQNRVVSAQVAAVLRHFHPGEYSSDWLDEPVRAQIRYVEGEWPPDDQTGVLTAPPVTLDPDRLYTATSLLAGLTPGTEYAYKVRVFPEGEPDEAYEPAAVFHVRTLPNTPETVRFGWVVCHEQGGLGHPFKAYRFLAERGMDFIVHLGDYIYNDMGTSDTGRASTTRGYLVEYLNSADDRYMPDFVQQRGLFMMWDDHEVWDAWDFSWQDPANDTPSVPDPDITRFELFQRAKHAFNAWAGDGCLNLPVPGSDDQDYLNREYYRSWETARCKFILLDTRSQQQRSIGFMIGAAQKAWLLDELAANTKPIVFLFTPSTWGDVVYTFDNWNFGCFKSQRDQIEAFFQHQTNRGRLFILSGDRHASFVHTRFSESRIVCEADACPASMNVWEYDPDVADWPGVLFLSVDGADMTVPERARMCGGVEVDELTGAVTICIIDAETGEDLFQHTFLVPLCAEDLNGDGVIGQDDLGQLLGSYLKDAGGDIDGDGDTDQADLAALLASYGDPCL
ncbi:MAG: alkaline phosphatase D family protein [Phycisphaerales bacterium JB038]